MNYKVYQLRFTSPVHFGNGTLGNTEFVLRADTLFSALCNEAVKQKQEKLQQLVWAVKAGELKLSDGLPVLSNTMYIPKPRYRVPVEQEGDSVVKKAFKKLQYIPIDKLDQYIEGNLEPAKENNLFQSFGKTKLYTKVSKQGEEAEPYYVEVFEYGQCAGLYIITGYEKEEWLILLEELLENVSYVGIGGKRSAGYGMFELIPISEKKLPAGFIRRLQSRSYHRYMTLGVSMAKEEELEQAMEGASYSLCKRGGFVQSVQYAGEQRKKKDIYLFEAGSCFLHMFQGDIFDLQKDGAHPVYRYGVPMFIGVD